MPLGITRSQSVLSAFVVAAMSVVFLPTTALAQRGATGGGVTGGGGGGVVDSNQNRDAGAVDAAAGSSEQINRDFGDGLVGRGDTAGSRFIGNQNASTGNAGGQAPRNFQNLNRQRAQQDRPTGSPVRARLVLGFTPPSRSSVSLSGGAAGLFTRALERNAPGTRVSLQPDGTAVLAGIVSSQRERKLAEALLRLEPGVKKVDNQLSISDAVPPLP